MRVPPQDFIPAWRGVQGKPFVVVTPNGPTDGGDFGPQTAGTSPYTFPILPYDAIYVLTTVGGLSSLTLDGQAVSPMNAIGNSVYVSAGRVLTATWSTTAPVFEVLPR